MSMKIIITVQVLGYRFRLWLRDLVGDLVERLYRRRLTRKLIELIAAEILARIAHSEIQALQDNQHRTEADDARLDFLYGMYLKLMQVGAGQMSLDDIIREYGRQNAPTGKEKVSLYVTMQDIKAYMK
jgi:hypothetical protein